MELERLALDAVVAAAVAPRRRLLGADGEQHRRVRHQPAGADVVDRAHGLGAHAAHDALVDERAAHVAVGDHGRAALQCRRDDVLDELGAGRSEEQRLGAGADRLAALQHDRAHALPRRRAAGLAHLDHLGAAGAQVRGEQSCLRRLARAVGTFERDESQAVMLRAIPGDVGDDSRTAQEPERAWRNVSLTCLPHLRTSFMDTATRCVS